MTGLALYIAEEAMHDMHGPGVGTGAGTGAGTGVAAGIDTGGTGAW